MYRAIILYTLSNSLESNPSQSHRHPPPQNFSPSRPSIALPSPSSRTSKHATSLPTRGTTRKTGHPEERPQDTAQTPRQAEQTAEVERGSRVRGEGDPDLQAALGVPAVLVDAGALDEVGHGAEGGGADGVFGGGAFGVRVDFVPGFGFALRGF